MDKDRGETPSCDLGWHGRAAVCLGGAQEIGTSENLVLSPQ